MNSLRGTARKTIRRRVQVSSISQMVVEALKVLKHPDGVTLQEIRDCIIDMQGDEIDDVVINKVPSALNRGVQFGAIKQCENYYKLDAIMVMASRRLQAKTPNGDPPVRRGRKKGVPQTRKAAAKKQPPTKRQSLANKH